jgi:uncharacterized protein DUF2865
MPLRQAEERPKRTGGTYRTLCVRLCDGFYFPISYSTLRKRFAGDAKQCEQRCPSGSRLFVYRNPGEDIDDMIDLQGRAYRKLPTALLHRTQYVADCTSPLSSIDRIHKTVRVTPRLPLTSPTSS